MYSVSMPRHSERSEGVLKEMKKSGFMKFEIICLSVQLIVILLTFAYAFFGSYESNVPSNIFSIIWSKGLALILLLSDVVAFISGLTGIIMHKENKVQLKLSVLLLCTIPVSFAGLILAVGSNY